jgi:predicted dehydrogenase
LERTTYIETKMKKILIAFILLFQYTYTQAQNFTIAVAGLTHDHVHEVLRKAKSGDYKLIGIAESNRAIAEKYAKRYGFSMDIVYPTLEELLKNITPDAVCAYNSIKEHLEVVKLCAPKGIHVMVEKPLAVSLGDAKIMEKLAIDHNIQLITNYETTWYPTNHKVKEILSIEKETYGKIRKIVIHDGHKGPKEIGVSKEFLAWLTDPYYNGAGALIDFGCYGANLSTWLNDGQRPISVTAVTQQLKPLIYPKVDDEATVILEYPNSQSIIQASWNWSFGRKDMEVYTERGFLNPKNKYDIGIRPNEQSSEEVVKLNELPNLMSDSFRYLKGVIRGDIHAKPSDLSSLENNMVVMEILQAAMISAKEGRKVLLSEFGK